MSGDARTVRLRTMLLGVLAAIVVAALATWAVLTVLAPTHEPAQATEPTYATVTEGEIGQTLPVNVIAQWPVRVAAHNRAAGVVTGVRLAEITEVKPGQVAYRVAGRPVVLAKGSVPAYRDLMQGMRGTDVKQLQQLLRAVKVYSGPADGDFGYATTTAVQRWQKKLGTEQDGVVRLGDVVFLSALPAKVGVDPKIVYRDATLSGGEAAIQTVGTEPQFTVRLLQNQVALVRTGHIVQFRSGDQTLRGVIARIDEDPDTRELTAVLAGIDGASVCGEDCDSIATAGASYLPGEIVYAETMTGILVPVAALVTEPDGRVVVIGANGDAIPVQVLGSANGQAVVTGALAAGDRVQLGVAASGANAGNGANSDSSAGSGGEPPAAAQ